MSNGGKYYWEMKQIRVEINFLGKFRLISPTPT